MEYIPEPAVLTLDPNDENIILGIPEDRDPNKEVAEPVKKEKVRKRYVSLLVLKKCNAIAAAWASRWLSVRLRQFQC